MNIFLIIILMTAPAFATPADDMRQIAKAYAALDTWSVNLNYALFSNFTCLNPQLTEHGLYIKSGKCEYLKVSSVENITAPAFGITTDADTKTLTLFSPSGKSLNPVNPQMALDMCEKITPVTAKDGTRGYYFLFSPGADAELVGISLLFDDKTWLVKKLTLFYKANTTGDKSLSDMPRMEITYFNYNTKPGLAADLFSLGRYVSGKGAGARGLNEYKFYSVMDYRKE